MKLFKRGFIAVSIVVLSFAATLLGQDITITAPGEGDMWMRGTTRTITWDYTIPDTEFVKIDLYKDLVFVEELAVTSCSGEFEWAIPEETPEGADYFIRITGVETPAATDDSGVFEIYQLQAPALTSPVDGLETYDRDVTFSWEAATGATAYVIYISDNDTFAGASGIEVAVPEYDPGLDIPYGTWYWRVYSKAGSITSDYSETWSFTVLGPPDIPVLTSPADGSVIDFFTPTFEWEEVSGAIDYELLVATDDSFDAGFIVIDEVVAGTEYTPADNLTNFTTYYWKLRARNAGGFGDYSAVWTFEILDTSIETDSSIPTTTSLNQNYPNPFNPETTVSFDIAENSQVNISVYNYKGELVRTLVNQNKSIGRYTVKWHGDNFRGQTVNSGMYFIVMETENYRQTVKALMVK